jgi:UDP-4-amino-4,6-dideoxy-N-acetyl-beta-L-altrosamine N-acetyltransferase
MFDNFEIRMVSERDLSMILAWRNHENVRQHMFTQHEIGLDEHKKWFVKVSQDPCRCLLIVEEGKQAIGYVQFSNVEEGGIADWGFYARPDAPKGTGSKLGVMALNHAFGPLKLHKICGQAIDSNHASIALHQALGFAQEGILRDQLRINGIYRRVHCFGLLSYEWQPKIDERE